MAQKHNPFDPLNLPDAQTPADALVLQSHGMVAGETVAQWTQDWWTWALQSPAVASPMLDPTGANANVNNSVAMFFIGGSFGGDATRTFDVPVGKPLLVPILNDLALQFTGKGPDPLTGGKGAANQALTDWQHSVTNLFFNIDGKPVSNLQSDLVRTDWFSAGTVQPGSLAESFGLTGDLGPSKSDGYWAVVKGLTAGSTHTLEFGGSTSNGFSIDITDTIHVV